MACNKIDNYDRPNGGIYGKLIDKISNEQLQTEQPNGFIIRLFEKGGQTQSPIAFFGKPDGTYENAWIFQNEYKVLPTEGAFFPVDTVTISIGEYTELNFEVMPFLSLKNVNVTPVAGGVETTYQIVRDQVGDKIVEATTLISTVPTVNNNVFDFKATNDLTSTADDVILASTITDKVSDLMAGNVYYVRIAVRTNNNLKKYNYSKVFQVTIL